MADCLDILQRNGVNSIRLRIWNQPLGGFCNLERTLVMAKRIKALGLHFLLDFHYSDKWAYPWTLEKRDGLSFIVDKEQQLHEGYPATVEGQTRYLGDFVFVIKSTPDDKGSGFHYWEPCWIPSKPDWSVGHANNWSNLTLFDFGGVKLGSLEIFK